MSAEYISFTMFSDTRAAEKREFSDVPWADFLQRLREPQSYKKKSECPLISCGEYGEQRTNNHALRHAANLLRIFAIEGDYDGERMSIDEAAGKLQTAGIAAALYTSPSHSPQRPRWRVIAPLGDPEVPQKRGELVGRINRILGGVLTRESFTLSQSFYVGRVTGREYRTLTTEGRTIDVATELEPLYPANGHARGEYDPTPDAELRECFTLASGRHDAMLKLSSRWAARGMKADDIAAALQALLDGSPDLATAHHNELRAEVARIARSAEEEFGESRKHARDEDRHGNRTEQRLGLRWFADSTVHTVPAIISGLLGDTALILVYGASGSGKSTIVLDIGLAIARELPWRGCAVRGGLAVHVCGEGTHGVTQRLIAYANRYMGGKLEDIPFAIVPGAVSLMDPAAITVLIDTLNEIGREHGGIRLLTFDTLARCLPGDENDSGDMAVAIMACDRIRKALSCAICVVHHSGKDTTRGARGHSSLRAAVDTEILVEEVSGVRWATVLKQRDLPTIGPFGFTLVAVEIGTDDDGQPITACVVEHQMDAKIVEPRPELRGRAQRQLLAVLRARTDNTWTMADMREIGRQAGMHKNTARAAVEALVFTPFMTPTIGGYRLSND